MTNLAFGGHFGIFPPIHLAHVEEMEVLWIMTQGCLWTSQENIHIYSQVYALYTFDVSYIKVPHKL